jgi:hypothetical protein
MLIAQMLWKFGRKRAWRQLGYAFDGMIAGLRNERGPPVWLGAR